MTSAHLSARVPLLNTFVNCPVYPIYAFLQYLQPLLIRHYSFSHVQLSSDNLVQPFSGEEAAHSKDEKSCSETPEPCQITLVLLTWDPDVHTPETSDNIHGKNDRAEHSEFPEDVGRLFLSLVHTDVDLS